jgi:hypothetical protein
VVASGRDGLQSVAETQEVFLPDCIQHFDVELLGWAYGWLRKEASAGVDGVTWEAYGEGLERRLVDLHSRIHRGDNRAQPSRRVYIPKPDGRERPLGIAALEDKIVQRALVDTFCTGTGRSHGWPVDRGRSASGRLESRSR